VFWTNIESSVKILREIDVFIIKLLLSLEAVGLYFAARKISDSVIVATSPIYYAIYPELARFAALNDYRAMRRLIWRSSMIVTAAAASVCVVFLLFGESFLALVVGDAYRSAYSVTALCLFGALVWAAVQALSPAIFSLGMVRSAFTIHIVTACVYIATLAPAIKIGGLAGAGAAYSFLFILWGGMAAFILAVEFRRIES
jgi:O-antigen/teichoic acid export membrane protein